MVGRAVPSAPNFDDLAYFFGSDDFDNSAGGGFAELEVSAVVSDGTSDLVSVVTNCVFVPPANETYAYDADGNQTLVTTGTGAWHVEYNGENRPVKWTRVSPDSSTPTLISMAFDHRGRRRLYVEVTAGVTNKLHRFTYDDYVCIARNREVDAQHGAGSDDFIWDPTEPIATRPLMCNPSMAPPLLYCHDGNKNVSEIIFTDGTIAAHYEYSSFGKVVLVTSENEDQSTANLNPYRFSSEYADEILGVVYFNYRYYLPQQGRWLCRDLYDSEYVLPIKLPNLDNAYIYVSNRSMDEIDLLGLKDGFRDCEPPKIWKTKTEGGYIPLADGCSVPKCLEFLLPGTRDNPSGFASFLDACNYHDNCYSNCNKDKDSCDNEFYTKMLLACADATSKIKDSKLRNEQRERCDKWAERYYDAVSSWGAHLRNSPKLR